jgi:hypothetical protein
MNTTTQPTTVKRDYEARAAEKQRETVEKRATRETDEVGSREREIEFRPDLFEHHIIQDIPKDALGPQWHLFWGNYKNPRELHGYQRQGYQFVRPEEIPGGYTPDHLEDGTMEGKIISGDAVLLKLPMKVYQDFMHHFHNVVPSSHLAGIEQKARSAEQAKLKLEKVDGVEGLSLSNLGAKTIRNRHTYD